MNGKNFIIVTDANKQIGLGHISRVINIAKEAVLSNLDTIVYSISDVVSDFCDNENINFENSNNWGELITKLINKKPSTILIDVHQKDFTKFKELENYCEKLILVVSEVGYNFSPFGNHIIRIGSELDQWSWSDKILLEGKKIFIHAGRKWMIFRNEFKEIDYYTKEENTILIAHGGTDPYGLTNISIQALELTKQRWNVNVLVTKHFSNINEIYKQTKKSKHKYTIIKDSDNVAKKMKEATSAIINGGNIRYELCITGTPFVAISFQKKQFDCTEQISKLGAGVNLGVYKNIKYYDIGNNVEKLLLNKHKRQKIQQVMTDLFDLKGTERIIEFI